MLSPSRPGSWRPLVLVAVAVGGLAGRSAEPQAAGSPPVFGTGAAAITVDVVVVDGKGQPVRGLTKDDFTVLEDGRRQAVVAFEAREAGTAAGEPAVQAVAPLGETNEERARPERVLALLVDDLGISAPVMGQVKAALARWIERQARPRDELTILTTSGDVWWSDLAERGRDDLLLVLGRVRGKSLASPGGESMSDFEARQIAVTENVTDALIDTSGGGAAGLSRPRDVVAATPGGGAKFTGQSVIDRVAQRWWDAHYCGPCTDPYEPAGDCREMRICRQRVVSRAFELHQAWTRRATTVYGAVARLSRSLAAAPGRKSILLVSEELMDDTTMNLPIRDAIDASQRANTAIYFLGARGLAGGALNVAENQGMARPQDIGRISVEQVSLATAGGEALAEDTGGAAITHSNDLGAGLERMALDSSAYYLLGYQPDELPDGKWHSLEVKVARPGVKVRARKRYLALKPEEIAARRTAASGEARKEKPKEGATFVSKRSLSPTLLAGTAREGLPLRLAAYLQETNDRGLAKVQVVLEIDNGRVEIDRSVSPWQATLDLTIMAASLTQPPLVPIDERLQLSLDPGQVASGFWLVPRELWLPPGVSQIRALVRDSSGQAGLVSERLEVPDVDQTYLSTPLLSDRTLPPLRPGEPPRLLPTAHRVFGRRGPLYCQFEVFVFGGRNLPGSPRLSASHSLQRTGGEIVSTSEETPIDTDGSRAVRRLTLPIETLEPGGYELTVSVTDALAQRKLRARTSFVVERDAPAPSMPTGSN